jgi:hypothetical protein
MAVVENKEVFQPGVTPEGSPNWEEELGVAPKPAEAKPAEELPKPVDEDHPTKLGRKVKDLQDQLSSVLERFDAMIALQSEKPKPAAPVEDEDPELTRIVSKAVDRTKAELQKETEKENRARETYVNSYVDAVNKGFEEDLEPEIHAEVVKELLETNFQSYKRPTGNPLRDARINYTEGLAKILKGKRKAAQGAPNVKGDRKTAPTDLSASSRLDASPKKKIELDPYAKKFVASMGLAEDDEWVQESVGRV